MAEIALSLQRLDQIFDTLDPAPFHEKALDRNADAYLVESAGEYPPREPLVVVIHAPPALEHHVADVAAAIHGHFALAHAQAERRHRRRQRIGRISLVTGVGTLAVALLLRLEVERIGGALGGVLDEGLLILAWVALWRPIETIGFDSWESRDERRVLSKLSCVPVRFVALGQASHPDA
ncbi:hypothetical protein [Cognatilysobacter lacus]|uniref:Uncharacterized protein n=1 Tax=Cognatilysobacter lacus TaxID=1643323 RepID=A0A5D8Z4Z2_9GAMM|nr:hypothetical protein [Lysobacter lacus]TZF89809.1 hypothetical protein FW784_07850 [Lysobacter lacus]